MYKTVEFTGKTEEDAIQAGLAELGLERDDVSVEIVERHKSGFLGIGATPARVKITYGVDDTARVEEFIRGLVERMGSDAVPHAVRDEETGSIHVDFTGDNLGILIGRRGETLDAIQHLANDVLNRGQSKRTRVTVDAENYRAKREETLTKLAQKIAGKVRKYHRSVTLEAMNSYERHIIHTVLQDEPDVTTYSIGSDSNRRVVVAFSNDGKTPAPSNEGRRRNNSRDNGRRDRNRRREYTREPSEETSVASEETSDSEELDDTVNYGADIDFGEDLLGRTDGGNSGVREFK